MEPERYEDIAELAESIAEENFANGKTDLELILKKKNIILVKGNYEKYFIGTLYHKSKEFTVFLNMDMLDENKIPRIRFTIAHELGHYFIDEHRNLLKNGTSLSFNASHNCDLNEKEANHFASFLLMPTKRFLTKAFDTESGLPGILQLANQFESSIESTSIHYMKLNCCNGLLIRWKEDNTAQFHLCSNAFANIIGSGPKPSIQLNPVYLDKLKNELDAQGTEYKVLENATNLSRWLLHIGSGSALDLPALEQTLRLGAYGGITLNYN
ncbi:ImmA/IrrE family metallo-endopeptidase [Mucilaginibacter sp. OK098]|uniref:ImmA/IrrE family metallo-endopeptidase n=1 Tax=Mucilaginibacter sp. OK098 TaxID=1855297 RepID=UPI000920B29C|nr:ImmA/IrrE family metallo-endopeptidase [Mucilaginibacter sp. OK098]SHN32873.1 Zn-dependent peptidase ImmA, M78 family [Mucilaginibacter sp. OK098]